MSQLSYNDNGKGNVVVLIHGFCESKKIWAAFEAFLSKKYRVLCPDLPGFGESPLRAEGISIEYYAELIADLLKELNIKKCTLIGHSLGGYIALAFAEKYPSLLNGFGLFQSTAFADSEEKKEGRDKTILFLKKHGVKLFAQSFVAPLFHQASREKLKNDIDFMTSIASSSTLEGTIEASKAMRDRKERIEVLKNSQVPVLFIAGKEDTVVPLSKSLEQCSLAQDNHVYFLSGTAHMAMFERKNETIKIVDNFISFINNNTLA
jgi:pimeloyl-ACP methyl ester carboxylesterase